MLFVATARDQYKYEGCLNGCYYVVRGERGKSYFMPDDVARLEYESALDDHRRRVAAKADYDARWPAIEELRTSDPEV